MVDAVGDLGRGAVREFDRPYTWQTYLLCLPYLFNAIIRMYPLLRRFAMAILPGPAVTGKVISKVEVEN